ncbi:MAG: acyltransferase [Clostridia bacterium]|nr:acyltransferase [Clostridia bacterium]
MDAPYSSSRNSFHLMRFVLAALVILCHSFTLLGRTTPLSALTGGLMNEGTLAVDGFLTISGFLICQSAVRSRNALTFLGKRLARILPAFCCALAFSALLVGALVFPGDVVSYVRQGEGGPLTWIVNWLTLNVMPEQWGVSGVFAGNPTTSLNVSLWTIKFEFALYLVMALLMLTTLSRRRATYIVCFSVFLILRTLLIPFGVRLWDVYDTRLWLLSHWNYDRLTETGLFFFTGTLLYAYRQEIPRRWYLAVIALLALVVCGFFRFVPAQVDAAQDEAARLMWQLGELPLRLVYCAAVPCLVIYLGGSPLCSGFSRLGDLSLGMYVYSYPIQQMIIFCAPEITPLPLFALTLAIVLPLAAWSWRTIEAPVLRLKHLKQRSGAER